MFNHGLFSFCEGVLCQSVKFSEKLSNYWFAGLKKIFRKFCLVVVFVYGFTCSPWNNADSFSKNIWVKLLIFYNVCNASTRIRKETSWFFLPSTVDCGFWGSYGIGLPTISFSEKFSEVGFIVLDYFGSMEMLFMIMLKKKFFGNFRLLKGPQISCIVGTVLKLASRMFFVLFAWWSLRVGKRNLSWTPTTISRRFTFRDQSLRKLILSTLHFKMRIILDTMFIRCPVFFC